MSRSSYRRVLVVCKGNTIRSPMMAVVLQKMLGPDYEVESAGLTQGTNGLPPHGHAVAAMAKRGFDISEHRARYIGDLTLAKYEYVVTVDSTDTHDALLRLIGVDGPLLVVANAPRGITSPFMGSPADFDACAHEIECAMPDVATIIRQAIVRQ